MMLRRDIQNVGKNSDSVGCERLAMTVLGNMIMRRDIMVVKVRNRMMSRIYTMSPKIVRPLNRCGVWEKSRAIPPVLIVHVYHAQVKWWMRSLKPMFPCSVEKLVFSSPRCPSIEFPDVLLLVVEARRPLGMLIALSVISMVVCGIVLADFECL